MSAANKSSAEFFETKYQQKADPWNFAHSPYEQHRYDALMKALSCRRYVRAYEPGCSIGILTERLAAICDSVVAVDLSRTAAESARKRCTYLPNVEIKCASIRAPTNLGALDLIVLSEVGYYQDPEDWNDTVNRLLVTLKDQATVLAAHWLGISADHRISGDEVHQILRASPMLRLEYAERSAAFRLDRWVRV